jgi:hypothetical protein
VVPANFLGARLIRLLLAGVVEEGFNPGEKLLLVPRVGDEAADAWSDALAADPTTRSCRPRVRPWPRGRRGSGSSTRETLCAWSPSRSVTCPAAVPPAPPDRWVIYLSDDGVFLIPPQEYYTVSEAEDRLFIPEEYVPLFVEAGWRRRL